MSNKNCTEIDYANLPETRKYDDSVFTCQHDCEYCIANKCCCVHYYPLGKHCDNCGRPAVGSEIYYGKDYCKVCNNDIEPLEYYHCESVTCHNKILEKINSSHSDGNQLCGFHPM